MFYQSLVILSTDRRPDHVNRLQQIVDCLSRGEVEIDGRRIAEWMQNSSLHPLSPSEYSSITNTDITQTESTKCLLNIVIKHSSDKEFYRCFLTALEDSDHQYVAEWISHSGMFQLSPRFATSLYIFTREQTVVF